MGQINPKMAKDLEKSPDISTLPFQETLDIPGIFKRCVCKHKGSIKLRNTTAY